MTAPERTLAQRLAALEHGNVIRTRRAILKRDLKAGRRSIVDVLAAPPDWLETMHVLDLLLAVPKVGRVKAGKTLRDCRVSPSKTVGGLSERQRGELVGHLRYPTEGMRLAALRAGDARVLAGGRFAAGATEVAR